MIRDSSAGGVLDWVEEKEMEWYECGEADCESGTTALCSVSS